MAPDVKPPPKRQYRSPRRAEQAQQTRRAIRDAAERLFLEHGYAATSITAIAEAAGVAPETVYSAFKNKRALLLEIEDTLIVGDDAPVPLVERTEVLEAMSSPDPHLRVRVLSQIGYAAIARTGRIARVMRNAADGDPELAAINDARKQAQYSDVRTLVGSFADAGSLVLDRDDAIDLVYALQTTEIHDRLVRDRGWTDERYVEAMTMLMERLLSDDVGTTAG